MKFALAYKPDPPDPRDKPFALVREKLAAKPAAGASVFALPQTTGVSEQDQNDCAANAGCDAFELLSPDPVQLSRRSCYFLARLIDGDECKNEGTYVRSVMKTFSGPGVCRESLWPYSSDVFTRPSLEALEDGYDHRISGYYRITTRGHARGDDIETALRAGHPVVFGTEVGKNFPDYDEGESVVWQYPDRSVGGHAMVIVGVRRNDDGTRDFLVRNSWGDAWGLRSRPGHAWFSERYVWEITDLWVPTQEWS